MQRHKHLSHSRESAILFHQCMFTQKFHYLIWAIATVAVFVQFVPNTLSSKTAHKMLVKFYGINNFNFNILCQYLIWDYFKLQIRLT